MNDHRCAVCGHINSAVAKLCDVCESRLDEPSGGGAGEPYHTYGEGADAATAFIPSTRFKGVGDVFGPTLEIYRKNFLLIITLVVVATLPAVLLQYGLLQLFASAPGNTFSAVIPASLLVWLVSQAGAALMYGSLTYAVFDLQLAGSASAGESLRRGLKVMPKLFLIDLMWSVLIGVGSVLFLVPGIIFSLMYALPVPVAIAEKRGLVESFDRSSKLTKGYKGLMFLTYFLWVIAISVIAFIVGGSFAYSSRDQSSFAMTLAQALVIGILNSSTAVLTVFIYLGLLHERRYGFDTRTFTPAGNPAER
jgi:hypothetical protein